MKDPFDRFQAAVTLLAGHGHIKQRLIKAYEDHLNDIGEDELPLALQQDFADLKRSMHQVSPLNGEGPICASVRKMSVAEASDCSAAIVSLLGAMTKYADGGQAPLPLQQETAVRVPPFLIKSV